MARILITGFCSYPGPDRVGVQLGHVVDGLVREHKVDLLVWRDKGQSHREIIRGANVLRVSMPKDPTAQVEAFQRALRRQLGAIQYDVVQFRDGWSGVTALEMKRKHKFATVFDVTRSPMALSAMVDLATDTELQRAHQSCLRRADLILAPSKEAQQFLAGVTDEPKLHVVPPGVNIDTFDWDEKTSGRPVILYLGKIASGCGIERLLAAMEVVRDNSDAILLLGGDVSPAFLATLEVEIAEMGLAECVRVLGQIPHKKIPNAIALATICVVPQEAEIDSPITLFPTKILEFMACRRVTVGPRGTTAEKIIDDGQNGLLFDPEEPGDFARKLLSLLKNQELRKEMELLGYERVRRHYSASGTRRKLRLAYHWLSEQSAYKRRMANAVGAEVVSNSILLVGSDLMASVDEEIPPLAIDDTDQVDAVSAPLVESGEVTRVEQNLLLRSNRRSDPDELVDVAGTINSVQGAIVPAAEEAWARIETSVLEDDEDDDDAGTGEIDPVPWIDDSVLEMVEDDSVLAVADDTDTQTPLARAPAPSK